LNIPGSKPTGPEEFDTIIPGSEAEFSEKYPVLDLFSFNSNDVLLVFGIKLTSSFFIISVSSLTSIYDCNLY